MPSVPLIVFCLVAAAVVGLFVGRKKSVPADEPANLIAPLALPLMSRFGLVQFAAGKPRIKPKGDDLVKVLTKLVPLFMRVALTIVFTVLGCIRL